LLLVQAAQAKAVIAGRHQDKVAQVLTGLVSLQLAVVLGQTLTPQITQRQAVMVAQALAVLMTGTHLATAQQEQATKVVIHRLKAQTGV
jgi:hypothetical protein